MGFSPTAIYDATSDLIADHVREFLEVAKDADWALFYYAGSGLEIGAVNCIVPIEADEKRVSTFTLDYPRMRIDSVYEAVA